MDPVEDLSCSIDIVVALKRHQELVRYIVNGSLAAFGLRLDFFLGLGGILGKILVSERNYLCAGIVIRVIRTRIDKDVLYKTAAVAIVSHIVHGT